MYRAYPLTSSGPDFVPFLLSYQWVRFRVEDFPAPRNARRSRRHHRQNPPHATLGQVQGPNALCLHRHLLPFHGRTHYDVCASGQRCECIFLCRHRLFLSDPSLSSIDAGTSPLRLLLYFCEFEGLFVRLLGLCLTSSFLFLPDRRA